MNDPAQAGADLRPRLLAELRGGRPDRALDLLLALLSSDQAPLAVCHDAHRLLPAILARLPRAAFGQARAAAMDRLFAVPPPLQSSTGDVEFPVVHGAQARLLCWHARAAVGGADEIDPADLSARTRRAVTDALSAARACCPGAGHLLLVLEPGAPLIDGGSCGLAAGLAAISAVTRTPLPPGLIATGSVRPDGIVEHIGGVQEKRGLVAEARPWEGTRLLVPLGQEGGDPACLGVRSLAEAWAYVQGAAAGRGWGAGALAAAALPGVGGPDLIDQFREVSAAFQAGRWPQAADLAARLLEAEESHQGGLHEEERVELCMIQLAAANHRGQHEAAADLAARLRPALGRGDIAARLAAQAVAHVAVRAVDLLCPAEAAAVLAQAEGLSLPAADEGWLHIRGAQALLAVLQGDLDQALALRQENVARARPDERARCLGDVADVHLRRGELAQARAAVDQALAACACPPRRRADYASTTARFVHLHAARVARAEGEVARAAHHLDQAVGEPGPGVLVTLERALLAPPSLRRAAVAAAGLAPDHGAPVLRALVLRALLLAGDNDAAAPLAALLGVIGLSLASLCQRVPY